MTRHNKKRNTGLVYEFLIRTITGAILEKNDALRDRSIKILREHFHQGTELLREFKLFNSLVTTSINSEEVAKSIVSAAKQASQKYDLMKLEGEKTALIKNINKNLNEDGNFFNQRIPKDMYKTFATIQSLINEWRDEDSDEIVNVSLYENYLKEWLLTEKNNNVLIENEKIKDDDVLVERILSKKLNEKYKNNLTNEQAELIKMYVFARESDEKKKKIVERLASIRENTIKNIDSYLSREGEKDSFVVEKMNKAKEIIVNESIEDVNEEVLQKFLDVCKLNHDLNEGEE